MARYRSPYSRRRGPWEKWIYIVVILLIVVAVLALVGYNPFAGTKDNLRKTPADLTMMVNARKS